MKFNRTDFLQMRIFSEGFRKGMLSAGFPEELNIDENYDTTDPVEVIVRNDLYRDMDNMFLAGHGWTRDEFVAEDRKYSKIQTEVKNSENPDLLKELTVLQKEYNAYMEEKTLRKADGTVDLKMSFMDENFKKPVMELVEKMGAVHERMDLSEAGARLILEKALDAGLGKSEEASKAATELLAKYESLGASIDES